MTRLVVDASALAAVIFQEPDGEIIRERLDGAVVFAPALLKFELANVAWKKAMRQPSRGVTILSALAIGLDPRWGIVWQEVEVADVVLIAQAANISAYDATYLWLAGWLGADLVTLDKRLARAAEALSHPR